MKVLPHYNSLIVSDLLLVTGNINGFVGGSDADPQTADRQ